MLVLFNCEEKIKGVNKMKEKLTGFSMEELNKLPFTFLLSLLPLILYDWSNPTFTLLPYLGLLEFINGYRKAAITDFIILLFSIILLSYSDFY